jgi:hypothetical protein
MLFWIALAMRSRRSDESPTLSGETVRFATLGEVEAVTWVAAGFERYLRRRNVDPE